MSSGERRGDKDADTDSPNSMNGGNIGWVFFGKCQGFFHNEGHLLSRLTVVLNMTVSQVILIHGSCKEMEGEQSF